MNRIKLLKLLHKTLACIAVASGFFVAIAANAETIPFRQLCLLMLGGTAVFCGSVAGALWIGNELDYKQNAEKLHIK